MGKRLDEGRGCKEDIRDGDKRKEYTIFRFGQVAGREACNEDCGYYQSTEIVEEGFYYTISHPGCSRFHVRLREGVGNSWDWRVDEVAAERSQSGRSPPLKRREMKSKNALREFQIAIEVCKRIWKCGTDWLNTSRHDTRYTFTTLVGFKFYVQCKPSFLYDAPVQYRLRFGSVPETWTLRNKADMDECNRKNMALLQQMVIDYPQFALSCTYRVEVFNDDTSKSKMNIEGERLTMKRAINLLDVASKRATKYFQRNYFAEYLKGSKHSLQFVFVLALDFAIIISKVSKRIDEGDSPKAILGEPLVLNMIVDGEPTRSNRIQTNLLIHLMRADYNRLNNGYDMPLPGVKEELYDKDVHSGFVYINDIL